MSVHNRVLSSKEEHRSTLVLCIRNLLEEQRVGRPVKVLWKALLSIASRHQEQQPTHSLDGVSYPDLAGDKIV
jgi:hypothetical protein